MICSRRLRSSGCLPVDAVGPLALEPLRQGTPCRVPHVEASSLATTEFRKTLDTIGVTQRHAARLFSVSSRHIRRWRSGDRRVPHAVSVVCNLLTTGVVTIEQVEAAALVPEEVQQREGTVDQTGQSRPGLAPTFHVTVGRKDRDRPGRADVALVRAKAVTIAEKVVALASGACRW